MEDRQPSEPVDAKLVAKVRQRTGMPWMACKRILARMTLSERIEYIELCETQTSSFFHDPVEDDPAIRPIFLAAREQAKREVDEWHAQRMAELEQQSPAVANVFRSRLGLCHRHWARIKELLKEQHGIEWRSPADMNPGTCFD